MQKINFTKAVIVNLQPSESRYEVGDTKVPGLSIRISPYGTKTYQVLKKLKGKPRRISLGRHPDITVEQARKKASKTISDIVYSEIDPNEQKRKNKAENITLEDVFNDYLSSTNLRPASIANYKLAVLRDMKSWKDKPLKSISGLMVQKHHKALTEKSLTTANKTMRVLRALFNFARDQYEDADGRSLFPDNPTRKLKRQWNYEKRRKGYIAQHQFNEWFNATQQLPETLQRGDGVLARDYLLFLVFTGLRRREATSLRWTDIDLNAKRFIVRDTKNHDELWMPLSDYLVALLSDRKKYYKSIGPFPLEEPKRFVKIVREMSGIHFTIHDLRRTFITIAESLDIGAYTIKALVNHRSSNFDVTEGYVQINTERLRKPMQLITDCIMRLAENKADANIHTLVIPQI